MLFEAQIAYARGDIDFVYRRAEDFLAMDKGFYAMLSGGILLGRAAVWRGDVVLWQNAKRHILEAPYRDENSPDIIALAMMGAALGNEQFRAVGEGFQCLHALDSRFQKALVPRHENRKRGQGYVIGQRFFYHTKHLAVSDDHAGRLLQLGKYR